jgi:holo-[acyl-carrier protein] synthase
MSILGVGTEITDYLRITALINERGERFLRRVYTNAEIDYCSSRTEWMHHYAARWAAKEAVLRALGTGMRPGMQWRDIEIGNDSRGAPTVILHGAARTLLERRGIRRVHVAISHSRGAAVAFAVAEGEGA